jgi:hypothetical protein
MFNKDLNSVIFIFFVPYQASMVSIFERLRRAKIPMARQNETDMATKRTKVRPKILPYQVSELLSLHIRMVSRGF